MLFAEGKKLTNVKLNTITEFQTLWDFGINNTAKENISAENEPVIDPTSDTDKTKTTKKNNFPIFELNKKNLPNESKAKPKNLPNVSIADANSPATQSTEIRTPKVSKANKDKEPSSLRKRKFRSLDEKMDIIKLHENGAKLAKIAKDKGMAESSVRTIISQKEELKSKATLSQNTSLTTRP